MAFSKQYIEFDSNVLRNLQQIFWYIIHNSNLCSTEKYTNCSSNTLLSLVYFSTEQKKIYMVFSCQHIHLVYAFIWYLRVILLGCANKDLWALCTPIFIILVYCRTATSYFLVVRNNWYQSYNSTIIEIGAQKSQSGPIAWPKYHTCTLYLFSKLSIS